MNREIKFRAWDGEKMFNVFGIKWDTQHNFICGNDEWNHTNSYAPAEKVSKIIMQYTGIHDKNGKEIYEGDILNVKHPHDVGGDFGDTNGAVYWSISTNGWLHGNSNGRPGKGMWEYCEIIGNVYENKDLLTN